MTYRQRIARSVIGEIFEMQTKLVDFRTIATTETLLPFDEQDAAVMIDWANKARQQGAGIFLSRSAAADRDVESWLNAGLIVLSCPMLDMEILLIKAKAMESVQRQGRVYRAFIGDYANDQWGKKGAMFRSLKLGLKVIADLCISAPVNDQSSRRIVQLYG